jgi:outer membrane protein TolC
MTSRLHNLIFALLALSACCTIGCATTPKSPSPPVAPAKPSLFPETATAVRKPTQVHDAPAEIRLASYQSEPEEIKPGNEANLAAIDSDTLDNGRPITLLSVLEVVDRDNPNINVARHRVEEAYAVWQRADALWLPSIRGGINYNKHEGRIQDVAGNNIATSRGALYSGLGAFAVGAGSPAIPGVYANFHLADAVFQPRIAGHIAAARQANVEATVNDYLLQAAQAYFELLRAEQERAISEEIRGRAERLAKLTESYAKTGEGLAADFDRARTELAVRRNDVLRAEEAAQVASSRLAQLLRLDPTVPLVPQEPAMVPITLNQSDEPVQSLVAQGLMARPEARESRALVCEAVNRLERERYAPLIPSVLLGVSDGGFGAGLGGNIGNYGNRLDADAVAWWELRNLGLGDAAARSEMSSRVQQARWREISMLDQIAREVVESHAQVVARQKQLKIAEEAVEIARSSYDKNLDRIQNGQGLPLEALQSIQALSQAQREYLRVVTDHNLAQFTLQRATGSLTGDLVHQ